MRTLNIKNNKLQLKDDIETIFQKEVTKFGNGAKIDCLKRIGKGIFKKMLLNLKRILFGD